MWRLALVAAAGLGVTVTGCKNTKGGGGGSTAPNTTAQVRFFHAAPTVFTQIDAYVNDSLIVADVHYGHATTYLNVTPGASDTVKLTHTKAVTPLLTAVESFSAAHTFTFYDVGDTTVLPLLAADSNTSAGSGTVKLRLVHAAPSMASVDVYVSALGDPLPASPTLSGVPFPHVSRYLVLGTGSFEVRVTPAGSRSVAVDDSLPNLASGTARTVVILDKSGGGLPLTSVILPDAG